MFLPASLTRITFLPIVLCSAIQIADLSALGQATAVATGDTRTVAEPTFPFTCQTLTATFHDANEDVPASVEAVSTNPDQSRLQAALNACQGTSQAVELAMDPSGNNAFLTGPITIPTGVTLLVDPGVTLYFSRNAQDYDTVQGTHTCGTVNAGSNTTNCQNLISIKNDTNSGIMGYGKLNGRGGDVVLNSFPTTGYEASTTGKSWWDLATDANSDGGNQQNPRGIEISNSSSITLYKVTFKNSPNFHIATSGVNGLTIWDIKIITPYTARNTDGVDPGNSTNVTIKDSWISDGDDNVAVGAPSAMSANISVVNNHFYAGHGESIGSYTNGGVNNILFDSNAMYGDADVDGSNSTGIRIKSANDRGGIVQNIQYSNTCFANHGTQIQFTPVYNTNTGTLTPNFKNILLQNLRFSNQGAVATGTVQFTGASNNGTINPLMVTLDNVTMDTLSASNLTAPTNAQITFGPGQVSSTLTSLLLPYNGTNGNVITDARAASSLLPPACNFTFLAPELTGPQGVSQTVSTGQFPTAVVILSPTFSSASYPYPTGSVTLTDEAGRTSAATLSGTGDTTFIPITNAPSGTHTYTASYSGNSQYAAITSFGSYTVTVSGASLPGTSTALAGVPSATTYGVGFTAMASVSGSNPTGSVSFLVNGGVYASAPLSGGSASYAFNLPLGSYSLSAVYNGDSSNAGSSSSTNPVAVNGAPTSTTLVSTATTGTVGTPISLTATVTSPSGTPTGAVSFSYTTSTNNTATVIGTASLANGVAAYSALLPQGIDSVSANYIAGGNFSASSSSPAIVITVTAAPPVPISAAPVALPYTISTLVGGATSSSADTNCAGSVDRYGDGCLGTAINLPSGTDLRGVAVDPFGNVYFTDSNSTFIRKVSPAGIVTEFAGYLTGTACTPTGTVGCSPTLVKLSGKPRGVYADSLGNVFIATYGSETILEVKIADGKLYLVAGNGSAGTATGTDGDGGLATSATLNGPRSVASDAAGNIYIADTADNRIRKVLNPASGLPGAGTIQTIAGTGTSSSTGDGGLATAATISNPQGVLVDGSGNVYMAEASHVRAICVTCAAGSGLYNLLKNLGFAAPVNGDIYTLAGTASATNPALTPGPGNTVNMGPQKLGMDADGDLYIADSTNNVVWFEDGRTGYTQIIAGGGTAASCGGSAIGDGCAATQAVIGSNGGNGEGATVDQQGNLYIADSTNLRIRKVSNNLKFSPTPVGIAAAQTVKLHFTPGDTPTAITLSSPDFSLGTGACTTNSDTTSDCIYTAIFNPVVAGSRTAPLGVTTALGNPAHLGFSGTGQGAGATVDPATQLTFGISLTVNAVATDNSGNVYVADGTSKSVLEFAPGTTGIGAGVSAAFKTLGTFNNPSAVAVDSIGDVYVADASTGLVTQIAPFGTSKALTTGFTSPMGLAVDALNNLYVSDASAKSITEVGSNFSATRVIANTGLVSPAGLAIDANANVYVTDPAASAVYLYNAQSNTRTIATTAAVAPRSVAVDAAGNLLIADSASGSILAVPSNTASATFTVASNLTANTVALDSVGNLYTASAGGQVLELERTQGLTTFSRANNAPIVVNLLSTGNVAASLSATDPDQTNFSLTLTPSTNCAMTTTISIVIGGTCQFTSQFAPSSATNFFNTVTFSGNAANATLATPPTLELMQTGMNAPYPDTIALSSLSPTSPIYGQTVTVAVSVTSTDGSPTGTVQLLVDGANSGSPVTLNAGAAVFTLPTFNAGPHAIGANYSGDSSFAGGSAATLSVTIAPVTPTLSFASIPAETFGNAAFPVSATSASAGALTYSVVSGPATLSGASVTLTGAGIVIVSATQAANGNYASANAQAIISVAKQASVSTLRLSTTTINPGQSVTLTANISPSIIGSPTGSVIFFDGTTTLGTTPLTGGQAAYTTSTLLSGSHSITASYSGDGNFLTSSASAASTPIVVAPLDFTLATTGNGETIPSGGTASYPIVISPTFGTYPGVVTFTATGGPTGATYSFSPTSVAANAGTLTITMTVQASTGSASIHTAHRIVPFALALLLMPFAGLRTWKRHRSSLSHLVSLGVVALAASLAIFGLSGCGASKPNSQNFTVTMTATSGTVQHTTTVPLTVQ